jgi:hypothetical protein
MYAFDEDRNQALRRWAKGIYYMEAGAEVLIRSGFAAKMDKAGYLEQSDAFGEGRPAGHMAYPNAAGYYMNGGYLSGGESVIMRFAAAMLRQKVDEDDEEPITFPLDEIARLSRGWQALLLAAMSHAGGSHEHYPHPEIVERDGKAVLVTAPRDEKLPPLFPWPESGEA